MHRLHDIALAASVKKVINITPSSRKEERKKGRTKEQKNRRTEGQKDRRTEKEKEKRAKSKEKRKKEKKEKKKRTNAPTETSPLPQSHAQDLSVIRVRGNPSLRHSFRRTWPGAEARLLSEKEKEKEEEEEEEKRREDKRRQEKT